jgi:hypothetical protein
VQVKIGEGRIIDSRKCKSERSGGMMLYDYEARKSPASPKFSRVINVLAMSARVELKAWCCVCVVLLYECTG